MATAGTVRRAPHIAIGNGCVLVVGERGVACFAWVVLVVVDDGVDGVATDARSVIIRRPLAPPPLTAAAARRCATRSALEARRAAMPRLRAVGVGAVEPFILVVAFLKKGIIEPRPR